jgi:post-segregation antitoxin (ccd killing protein)
MENTGKDYSDDEIRFIREHVGEENHLSFGAIAEELNKKFITYNEGKRIRRGVQAFAQNDRNPFVYRQVKVEKELLEKATEKGIDLSRTLTIGLENIISPPPAQHTEQKAKGKAKA